MATYYSPKIVTDGLKVCLDAANYKSYPRSGTSWTDLSGNGNTGTLTNGPTFDSTSGGSILFDGTNDYIVGTGISSQFTTDITAEAWIKISSAPADWVRIIGTGGNTGNRTFGLWYSVNRQLLWQRYGGNDPSISPSNVLSTNTWYHCVATTSGTAHAIYLNGVSIGTATAAGAWGASSENITIGFAGFHTYITGNIACARLYNRGLTYNEVMQNYIATKNRFGL